jgi:hypothetical protein
MLAAVTEEVGVPLRTPVELRVNPAGRTFALHVNVPIPPVAVRVCE